MGPVLAGDDTVLDHLSLPGSAPRFPSKPELRTWAGIPPANRNSNFLLSRASFANPQRFCT